MSKWISVDEECGYDFPTDGDRVLVVANDIVNEWVDLIIYTDQGWCHIIDEEIALYPPIVTHWMPLPEPPTNTGVTDNE